MINTILGALVAATPVGAADVQSFPSFTCHDNGTFSNGPSAVMIDWEGSQALRDVCAVNGPGPVSGVELYVDMDPNIMVGGVVTNFSLHTTETHTSTRTVTDTVITRGTTDFSRGDIVGWAKNLQNGKSWAAWKKTMELGDKGYMHGTFTVTKPNGKTKVREMSNKRLINKCASGAFRCNKVEYVDREETNEYDVTVVTRGKRIKRWFCTTTYSYALAYNGVIIGHTDTGAPTCELT